MKKGLIIFLTAALLSAFWWLMTQRKSTGTAQGETDSRYIAEAQRRDIDFRVEVTGDITPAIQLEIKSEIGGKAAKIHVRAGDEVAAGDPLVDIDDTDLLTEKAGAGTEIEGAQLSVEKTRRNFERSKELFEGKLISREIYDNLEADLAISGNNLVKAQRKLEIVEDRLRKTRIFSPTIGTVLSVPVTEGQVVVPAASVNSGTTLMTIANLSQLLVQTHVNQIDIGKLVLGQEVKLKGETIKDLPVSAKVSFIAPVASVKSNVKGFAVEAVIENPDPRLRPGMTVLMDIPVASVEQAVAVPIAAIFTDEASNSEVVYVMNGKNPERREVEVGVSDLQFAEIKSGLKAGERILLVKPGTARKQS